MCSQQLVRKILVCSQYSRGEAETQKLGDLLELRDQSAALATTLALESDPQTGLCHGRLWTLLVLLELHFTHPEKGDNNNSTSWGGCAPQCPGVSSTCLMLSSCWLQCYYYFDTSNCFPVKKYTDCKVSTAL